MHNHRCGTVRQYFPSGRQFGISSTALPAQPVLDSNRIREHILSCPGYYRGHRHRASKQTGQPVVYFQRWCRLFFIHSLSYVGGLWSLFGHCSFRMVQEQSNKQDGNNWRVWNGHSELYWNNQPVLDGLQKSQQLYHQFNAHALGFGVGFVVGHRLCRPPRSDIQQIESHYSSTSEQSQSNTNHRSIPHNKQLPTNELWFWILR